MRILLDECVHSRLRNCFSDYDCQTARFAGLAGLKNGVLLSATERAGFDLLTLDQSIEYQQSLVGRRIAVMVVHARSNTMRDLRPHAPACVAALASIRPGQFVKINQA
jgi:predicted nuclease of predicted toxin-antitoxin system